MVNKKKDSYDLGMNFTQMPLFGALENSVPVIGNIFSNTMLSVLVIYDMRGNVLQVNGNELFRDKN